MSAYDFSNDEFPDDERRPYKLIRWCFLDCCYIYCAGKIHGRSHGQGGGWVKNESEYSYAYSQEEYAYSRPIEKLMLEVISIILNAGRDPETVEPYHRRKIASILEKHDLQDMLKELPDNERCEFEHDLRLLKIISS